MKAPVARHERQGGQSVICVICLLGVLVSAMTLGGTRLYGLYLEHRLASITKRSEAVKNSNSGMEEQYSALLSPSRIYNYARLQLNMTTAKKIETIQIRDGGETNVKFAHAGSNGRSEPASSPSGILGFFTGRANAKD